MSEVVMTHTKKPPKHWAELIDHCDRLTNDSPEITCAIALEAFTAAASIEDKEQRTDVQYFGMGRLTCHFSQLLERPRLRQHTISSAADALVADIKEDKKANGIMQVKHIAPKTLGIGFEKVTTMAEERLGMGERLLFEVMHGVTQFQVERQRTKLPDAVIMAPILKGIVIGGAARRVFRGSIMGGVATLFKDALLVRGAQSEESPVLQDDNTLRELGEELLAVGGKWAVTRLDEFNMAEHRVGEQDGKLQAQNIPEVVVPAVNYSACAHDDRHVCPAVFVRNATRTPDAIKGAVHQGVRILPEIVITARNRL